MVNERLAALTVLPPVTGVAFRRVPLPRNSPRGGLMTQASILKVTATAQRLLRYCAAPGSWSAFLANRRRRPRRAFRRSNRNIRGASTIRQQLDKHRTEPSCAVCHSKIDPAGFALESFDVMGGWRDRYRAMADVCRPTKD